MDIRTAACYDAPRGQCRHAWRVQRAQRTGADGGGITMRRDLTGKRARKLTTRHALTNEEIRRIIAAARITLATFDPEYRANVTQIASDLGRSRPTIYGWADRALVAMIGALRQIRAGRPPKPRADDAQ
jgi:hypothetical protein